MTNELCCSKCGRANHRDVANYCVDCGTLLMNPPPPEAGEAAPKTVLGHDRIPETEVYSKAGEEKAGNLGEKLS